MATQPIQADHMKFLMVLRQHPDNHLGNEM
jgi:hypothetical protein